MIILLGGLIGLCASLGCMSRLWVDSWVKAFKDHHEQFHPIPSPLNFPWGTVCVNIIGSFILGALVATPGVPQWIMLSIGTGFLGGFTTFSTAMLDVVTSWSQGHKTAGITDLLITAIASVAACYCGMSMVG